jgi:dTDP-4-dehydrorhamnose 3,5-epimerase-like enzyme
LLQLLTEKCSDDESGRGYHDICGIYRPDLMKATPTPLPRVLLLEPKVFGDERGFFLESYNEKVMADLGFRERFVQDNQSFSTRNVLRGLHYLKRTS